MSGLTPRQAEVLAWITRFIGTKGYSPTYRQIMEGMGTTSPAGASFQVRALARKGFLTFTDRTSRSIRLSTLSPCPSCEGLRQENAKLKADMAQAAERIARQSELLSKRTERVASVT